MSSFPTDLHLDIFFLCVFYHDAVSMAHANPCGQGCRRHTERNSQSGCNGRAAYVTKGEASGLPDSCSNRAGQTGAAPEPIAAWKRKQMVEIEQDDKNLREYIDLFSKTVWKINCLVFGMTMKRMNAIELVFVAGALTRLCVITA